MDESDKDHFQHSITSLRKENAQLRKDLDKLRSDFERFEKTVRQNVFINGGRMG